LDGALLVGDLVGDGDRVGAVDVAAATAVRATSVTARAPDAVCGHQTNRQPAITSNVIATKRARCLRVPLTASSRSAFGSTCGVCPVHDPATSPESHDALITHVRKPVVRRTEDIALLSTGQEHQIQLD
jgi:hypothetical protein